MKSPKFWLDIGLNGAECINMDERPDLVESLALFGGEFQPIGWPGEEVQRPDGQTIPSWIDQNCKYYNLEKNDQEIMTFVRKIIEVGQEHTEVVEVQWDEESVLVLKY